MSQTATVLVIDDEPQIRRFLDISLRAQGYRVALADSGHAGLAELAAHGADLVVLDIGLPDLDGHEVLRELRQWSQVPVIMLTVRDGEAEKVAALDGGANDYVTKPFGVQELMARIRGLLRAHAGATVEAPVVFDDGRLHVDLARREVKAAFLLIMCAEHALPHGGKITICQDEVGWSLTAQSPRLRVTSDLWSLISTATYPPTLTPAEVQFPLAALCLADLGRSPDLEQRDDTLRVSF